MENKLSTKTLFAQDNVKQKFQELLGTKAQGFMTSVLQIASSNTMLANADPMSIYNAAAVAATLDLPLNNNLGFAYIVPYNDRKAGKQVAQFQLGYKGFIQLAQRSGQFKTISATPILEGQLVEENPLTGFVFDFSKKTSDKIVGYAAYFKLLNGFEKTMYMTVDQIKSHGKKYSKTFGLQYGLWTTDFDGMAVKTVIKLLLSKFAPLSIEMQKAVIADQGVINNEDGTDVSYIDHEDVVDKEEERIQLLIDDAKTVEDLNKIEEHVKPGQADLFQSKKEKLSNGNGEYNF